MIFGVNVMKSKRIVFRLPIKAILDLLVMYPKALISFIKEDMSR